MSGKKLDIENLSFNDIKEIILLYIKNNLFSLGCLLLCVLLAWTNIFGFVGGNSWKSWEFCALGFTLVYTAYIYVNGWGKGFFNEISGKTGIVLGAASLALIGVTLVIGNELIHIFAFQPDRFWIMFSLLITTSLFVIVDFLLCKSLFSKQPKISKAYLSSLTFSDIPITLAFLLLTIYAFSLRREGILGQMDAFFGGTIAFQMIISNIVWTFTDDAFLETHSKMKKQEIVIGRP